MAKKSKKDFTDVAAAALYEDEESIVNRIIKGGVKPTEDAGGVTFNGASVRFRKEQQETPAPAPAAEQPKKTAKRPDDSEAGGKKVTFVLSDEMEYKLRYVQFIERRTRREIITDALQMYFAEHEAEHGKIL